MNPTSPPIYWSTPYVTFEAEEFVIKVNNKVFTAMGQSVRLNSDPGKKNIGKEDVHTIDITPSGGGIENDYTTLEVEWREHGVEMRLNLYFGAGDTHWWVTEIRHYNGTQRGRWVYYRDIYFRTPRGESFMGDVELVAGPHNEAVGSLTIRNLKLTTAF